MPPYSMFSIRVFKLSLNAIATVFFFARPPRPPAVSADAASDMSLPTDDGFYIEASAKRISFDDIRGHIGI